MRDNFKTIIQRTVALAVDMFAANVRLLLDSGCAIIVFSCAVNLQFYAEISGTISVEDRFRFVAVVVDTTAFIDFIAVAVSAIVVSVKVVCIVLVQ